jgi:hypothetical protein
MYCSSLNVNAYNFKSILLVYQWRWNIFNIVYHSLNNYNVLARFVGHDGEELCHGITISTKLLNNIIIVSHNLQDNIISKSIITKKFQNLFQINSFSHNIMFC